MRNIRWLPRLLARMKGREIVVIGDLILDEYLRGSAERISPEAPIPVVRIQSRTYRPGGAANVGANLQALGGVPLLVGVIGRDSAGTQFLKVLEDNHIYARFVLQANDARPTTLKTRVVANNQQVVRTDIETREPLSPKSRDGLLDGFKEAVTRADAVVISDYDKGVLAGDCLGQILAIVEKRGVPCFVDPKGGAIKLFPRVSLIKAGHAEAERMSGIEIKTDRDAEMVGQAILEMNQCQCVLLTRGAEGMSIIQRKKAPLHIPSLAREVYDVTGAGDTAIATVALAMSAGASVLEAAVLANAAASVVVGKVGTATVNPGELLERRESIPWPKQLQRVVAKAST